MGVPRHFWNCAIPFVVFLCLARVLSAQDEIPQPENLTLPTADNLELKVTFYGGVQKKNTIPIIVIHDLAGRRGQREVHDLALNLQRMQLGQSDFAVVVPDMRGHGESTLFTAAGKSANIKYDKMKPGQFQDMIQDVDSVKKLLMAKNNEGELNIEQLCIIGIGEMGSMIAWQYTNYDWSFPPLAGIGKQGQDVKALIMISPKISFKGMVLKADDSFVSSSLSTMIIRGKGDSDAKKWYDILKVKHPPLPKTPEDLARLQDLFLVELEAAVSGIRLLDPKNGLNVESKISQFLQLRLVNKSDQLRWQDRSPAKK